MKEKSCHSQIYMQSWAPKLGISDLCSKIDFSIKNYDNCASPFSFVYK